VFDGEITAGQPLDDHVLSGNTTYFWEVQGITPKAISRFSAIGSFTTADTAPAVSHFSNAMAISHHTFSVAGSFVDPDIGDSWTARVSYGDGTKSQPLTLDAENKFTLSHRYLSDGMFEVVVKITDAEGDAGIAKFHVSITDGI
jgi:hypothetical protein